eukprot:TRINITY_DN522_c0_g5_i1.p1 TRINITY_DN522_c0_g5~~TRINITY_DN522_c0_g5_i1.p1  ORF type:complete len:354 (+),score=64.85 TRINITY_DN522_c0_g5_i1:70-1131(+)
MENDEKKVLACIGLLYHIASNCREEVATPLPSNRAVTQEEVDDWAKVLTHEATKLVLALTNNPSFDTVGPVAEKNANHITAFTCMLRSLLPISGPTMKKKVIETNTTVLDSFRTLAQNILDSNGHLSEADVPKWTGVIWQACETLKSMPLNNKTAVSRGIISQMHMLKDALDELRQTKTELETLIEMQNNPSEDKEEEPEPLPEDLDGLTIEDVVVTEKDTELVVACLAFYEAAMSPAKQTYLFVARLDSPETDVKAQEEKVQEHIEWLERVLAHFADFSAAIDELGASLCIPFDTVPIGAYAANVRDVIGVLLDSASHNPAFANQEWIPAARAKIDASLAAFHQKLSDYPAQ